jgi:SAM-dependent methyltransferase
MNMASVGASATRTSLCIRPLDALTDAYLAGAPIAHALFRAAELRSVCGLELERPVLEVGCGIGQVARFALDEPADVGVDLSARRIRPEAGRGA